MVQKRILIAGCGDLGRSVAENWIEKGAAVSAIRRTGTLFPSGVAGITADLTNMALTHLPDVDLIYLIMTPQGRTEHDYLAAYVKTAQTLIDRYATDESRPKVIFVSSTSVYGENSGEWIDEASWAAPTKATSQTILNAEQLLSDAFDSCAARCSGIYGPGRYRLINKVKEGGSWGSNSWTNRIHRDDVVAGLTLLGEHMLSEQTATTPSHVIVTDDTPVSMWEVKLWIASRINAMVSVGSTDNFVPQSGKRIRASFLKQIGWTSKYPSYVSGYETLLQEKGEELS